MHRLQVDTPALKELRQWQPFLRRIRVERELRVPQGQLERAQQPFSTDRTEIAPGSNVIGEYFQDHLAHWKPPRRKA